MLHSFCFVAGTPDEFPQQNEGYIRRKAIKLPRSGLLDVPLYGELA
jgi:hypothetical protein